MESDKIKFKFSILSSISFNNLNVTFSIGADFVDAPLGSCLGDNIIRRPGKMGRTDKRETYVNMNMLMREQDFTDLRTFR